MPWESLLALVGLAVGLASGAASVAWVFRGKAAQDTIGLLEANVRAAHERVRDLEAGEVLWEERLDASAARNMALEARNHELLDLVTGRPELAELRERLDNYAVELAKEHRELLERIDAINNRLKGEPNEDPT